MYEKWIQVQILAAVTLDNLVRRVLRPFWWFMWSNSLRGWWDYSNVGMLIVLMKSAV